MMKKRAILMCAGEYEPVEILPGPEDLVVAVDGGLERLLSQQIEPDLVLGDFDSLPESCRPYLTALEEKDPERLLRLPCEKDDTDTIYAARVCLERGCEELALYGALGGRLDHTVANIQTLAWIRDRGADGYLLGKNVLATVLEEEKVLLPDGYAGTFSLFALDPEVAGVTLEGMKYPLSEAVLTSSFPLGVSNEVRGDRRAAVTVRRGKALMILQGGEKTPAGAVQLQRKRM
ncbi:MAG: thiamine diphosphokinase [Eubacteriales bacterium]|nr:thiamine diphosphokinase [Eubacteriales bacterium]